MNILNIIKYPNERLRVKSRNIYCKNDKNIINLINSLFDTMYYNNGIGISAIQVNININLSVIDLRTNNNKFILINPIILYKSKDFFISNEGCLSIPNVFCNIKRYKKIIIKYKNLKGDTFNLNTENNILLSSCIQHEIDHMNGILIIDYLSGIKKHMILKKYLKIIKK